jgi:hypothetical protein
LGLQGGLPIMLWAIKEKRDKINSMKLAELLIKNKYEFDRQNEVSCFYKWRCVVPYTTPQVFEFNVGAHFDFIIS